MRHTILLTLVLALCPACGDDSSGPEGADSPDALIERIRKAARNNDMGAMVALLAPADRQIVTGGLMMTLEMAARMGGDAKLKEGLEELKNKYDMSAVDKVDHIALAREAGELMESMGKGQGGKFKSMDVEPQDLKVEGDTASVKLGSQAIRMSKIDGRRYAHLKP